MKLGVLAFLVFLSCWLRLALEAPLYPLSLDEETGITEAIDISVPEILAGKLPTQINVSPLHYLMEKAWVGLTPAEFHRHWELNFYFRLRALTLFALTVALLFLLFRALALEAGAPEPLALLFGLTAAFFFQTSNQLTYGVAFQDRPYAIWLFLCALQMLLLARELARPTAKPSRLLALTGALLALNAYAAATQAVLATAVRWLALPSGGRDKKIFRECLPALILGFAYFLLRNVQHDPMNAAQFIDLWAEVLTRSLWSRADSILDWSTIHTPWAHSPPWQLALSGTLALAPLLLPGSKPLRLFALFCALTILSGVPTTAASWLVGGYLRSRYFLYLVPYFGALHLLGALAIGALLWERRSRVGQALLASWCAAQLAYRLNVFTHDLTLEIQRIPTLEIYRREASPLCPARITDFRYGITRRIDSARLRAACIQGKAAPVTPSPEDNRAR